MKISNLDQTKIKAKKPKIEKLLEHSKSLILATINEKGKPAASYSPFVYLNGAFYILVSYMAKHTRDLRDRKSVSVMLIDDETSTKQIYARNRLTLNCEAHLVKNESQEKADAIRELKNRHGKIIDVLGQLNDFVLFKLEPLDGSYVNGFGSAYSVNKDLTVNHQLRGAHGEHNEEE